MARKRRKALANGRTAGETRHVRLHHWMLKTAAYRSLSPAARSLLVELYALYDGENNGSLFLSVREAAERTNTGKNVAQRAFADLQDRGFIRMNRPGSFALKARHATSWAITEFAHAGRLATKDFIHWKAPEIQKSVPVAGPYGISGGTVAHLRRVK